MECTLNRIKIAHLIFNLNVFGSFPAICWHTYSRQVALENLMFTFFNRKHCFVGVNC